MPSLRFITSNKGKFLEAKKILPDLVWLNLSVQETQSLSPIEILRWKAYNLRCLIDGPFVVEDTGLFLECFNFKGPGPFVKFFLQMFTLQELVEFAKKKEKLRAKAVTLLAYSDEGFSIKFFKGETLGYICNPVVKSNFGWDPIFRPKGYSKVFAEMTTDEKNCASMRGKAFLKLLKFLKSNGRV